MNKMFQLNEKKYYEMIYRVCIGMTGIILLDSLLGYSWIKWLAVALVIGCSLLLSWSAKEPARLWIWGVIALLAAGLTFYLYRSGHDLERYFDTLELGAFCLGAAVLAWFSGKNLWLRLILILAELSGIIYCGIEEITVPKWGICVSFFCILMLITELVEKRASRKSGLEPLFLAPVFACLMIGFGFLPVRDTPMEWNAVKNVLTAAEQKANTAYLELRIWLAGKRGDYSLPFAGYDEDGTLAGSLHSMDRPQISVMGDQMKSPLYVSGSIYDVYNGNGWEKSTEAGEPYLTQYDTLKKAFEDSVYTENEIWELTRYRRYEIKYEGLRTESLFLAPVTDKIAMPHAEKTKDMPGGNLKLEKSQGVGFAYQIYFLEVDYGNEKIEQLLRQQAWKNPVAAEAEGQHDAEVTAIYQRDTKLPDSVPDRVYALAADITKDAKTDYDRLLAIEAYLNQFAYSKTLKECPEGMDPVDYFLFESQSGYCTYFASAMAVLARCEGIPVRYIEGFVTEEVCHTDREPVVLTGNHSHAWVEAYIEHIGWIPFEPTPGYGGHAKEQWETPHTAVELQGTGGMEKPEIMEADTTEQPETAEDIPATAERVKQAVLLTVKVLLFLFAAAGILAVFVLIRLWMRKKHYENQNEMDKLRELMKKVLGIGKLYGLELETGETLSSFGSRAEHTLDTDIQSFHDFCSLYEEARFAGKTIETESVKKAEQYLAALERQYLGECGSMKKFFYKIK